MTSQRPLMDGVIGIWPHIDFLNFYWDRFLSRDCPESDDGRWGGQSSCLQPVGRSSFACSWSHSHFGLVPSHEVERLHFAWNLRWPGRHQTKKIKLADSKKLAEREEARPACKVLKFNRLSVMEDFHTNTNLAQSSFSERDHRRCWAQGPRGARRAS